MRELQRVPARIAQIVAFAFSFLFVYTCGFGLISIEIHRGGYVLLTYLLIFLLFPFKRKSSSRNVTLLDWALCLLTVASVGYWIIEYPSYALRIGDPNRVDLTMGAILILLSFEAARRVVGYILPTLAAMMLLYAYFGPYIPGMFGHYGATLSRIVDFIGNSMGGIYGIVANTYATFIFPFIIFASFLQAAGAGKAVEEISLAAAGGTTGGPAKVAVVASAIIGSITGSSAANAVATGSYTIPLMIKSGYKRHVAAAVEAAASTGGQFLPPVMGAAAFLIAAFTDTAYLEVVKLSIFPALIYFVGVGGMVHFIAARSGLKGLPREQLPKLRTALWRRGHLLLPILVILGILLRGYTAQIAAFWAIVSTVALSYIRKDTRMGLSQIVDGFILGARNSLTVGATVGIIGIIIGVVTMSGLGIKFSHAILSLSMGLLPLTLLLVAIGGYIIGMGVTITATYILLSVLAVPSLMDFGISLLAAHLIVFWFCETGGITPPVALVAFAASGVAQCNPNKAGFAAVRLASPLFIMPVLFAYTPILMDGALPAVIETLVSSLIGIVCYAGMMQGYWFRYATAWDRMLLGAAALCLFIPNLMTDFLGIAIMIGTSVINLKRPVESAA